MDILPKEKNSLFQVFSLFFLTESDIIMYEVQIDFTFSFIAEPLHELLIAAEIREKPF